MRIEGNMEAIIKTMKIRVLQEHESKEQSTAEELEMQREKKSRKETSKVENRQLNAWKLKEEKGPTNTEDH